MEGTHPWQWSGVTRGGVEIFRKNAGQSLAREHNLRLLKIEGPDIMHPFAIEIPTGAQPVIFRRGTVGGGKHSFTFWYGWEAPGRVEVWQFGDGSPKRWVGRDVRYVERG